MAIVRIRLPDVSDMSLPYSELWFLETAVQRHCAWLPFLFLPEGKEEQEKLWSSFWDSPAHHLSVTGVGQVLWLLFQRGDIQFRLAKLREEGKPFRPNSGSQLAELITSDFHRFEESGRWNSTSLFHWYSITPAGFARWEKVAVPDWSCFIGEFTEQTQAPGEAVWTQAAESQAHAMKLLDFRTLHFRAKDTIDWKSMTVAPLAPWRPMPLKELPAGVQVTVRVTPAPVKTSTANKQESLEYADWNADHARRCRDLERWFQYGIGNHPQRPRKVE